MLLEELTGDERTLVVVALQALFRERLSASNAVFTVCGVVSENGIYGHSRFCNTDFDDKLACLNLSGV